MPQTSTRRSGIATGQQTQSCEGDNTMNDIPITSVKETRDEAGNLTGWVVDGNLHVPDAPGNRYREAVQQWIVDGNTPEPFRTVEEQAAYDAQQERQWRDGELQRADIEILKLQDVAGDCSAWCQYRIALRDWPAHADFPDATKRPVSP